MKPCKRPGRRARISFLGHPEIISVASALSVEPPNLGHLQESLVLEHMMNVRRDQGCPLLRGVLCQRFHSTSHKWKVLILYSSPLLKGNCNGKISFLLLAFLSSLRSISKCGKISKLLVKYVAS